MFRSRTSTACLAVVREALRATALLFARGPARVRLRAGLDGS